MESAVTLIEHAEIVPFLSTLELSYDGLVDVIRYADNERALCTGNDPKGFGLIVMNARTVRGLRETFCSERWEPDDKDNQAGICNPHLKIRVIHCNFDQHAGDKNVTPSNLTLKGTASRNKVRCNRTAWLPGFPMPLEASPEYTTWVLGTHFDEVQGLQAELSQPADFGSGRYIEFAQRVMLLTGSEDSPVDEQLQEPPTDIIDIKITRR